MNPAAMTERLIDAAIYNEQASGAYVAGARKELNEARAAIEDALSAKDRELAEARNKTIDNPQVSEWVVMANARRISSRRFSRLPNWALAMEAFGLGSTWARALCNRIGIDPDSRTMERSS